MAPIVGDTVTITIPDIPNILGPLLVGLILNWGLLGVLSTQVYVYYLCFPKDSVYTKALVYFLYCVELVQTFILTRDSWQWFINDWGQPARVGDILLEWLNLPMMDGIIACIVQLFFAYRIWTLGRSWPLVAVVVVLSLLQGSAGIATGVQAKSRLIWENLGPIFPVVSVWLATSAAVDIIVALSMTYLLLKRRTSFYHTQVLISRLIRLAIETGSVTAAVAIIDVTLFNTTKGTNLHACPAIVLAKVYTNTLLVVLNNRIYIRGENIADRMAGVTSSSGPSRDVSSNRLTEALSQQRPKTVSDHIHSIPGKPRPYGEDIHLDTIRSKGVSSADDRELSKAGPINIWIEREETRGNL